MINSSINTMFDRYTTSNTIEFRQKRDKDCIIPAKLHHDVYPDILLIDPTTKLLTTIGNCFFARVYY